MIPVSCDLSGRGHRPLAARIHLPASGDAEDWGGTAMLPAFSSNTILFAGLSSSRGQHRTGARRRGFVARPVACPAGRATGSQVPADKKIWQARAA